MEAIGAGRPAVPVRQDGDASGVGGPEPEPGAALVGMAVSTASAQQVRQNGAVDPALAGVLAEIRQELANTDDGEENLGA